MKKLLVHGVFDLTNPISPFPILCVSLMDALRDRRGHISLVFVCSCHLADDKLAEAVAMIRSLMGQPLEQHAICPDSLEEHASLEVVRKGDIKKLSKLSSCLARRVHGNITIFCMIDGIQFYERELYIDEVDQILCCIVPLAEDKGKGLKAVMKIFLSSPEEKTHVRQLFEAGSSLLKTAAITCNEQVGSQRRLGRRLGGVLL